MDIPNHLRPVYAEVGTPTPTASSQPTSLLSPELFASLGVTGVFLVLLGLSFYRVLPTYFERWVTLREEAVKAARLAEQQEQAADLKREADTLGLLSDFTKTLLANQLQTSKQLQEEIVELQKATADKLTTINKDLTIILQNQGRFFEITDQIKRDIAALRIEKEMKGDRTNE